MSAYVARRVPIVRDILALPGPQPGGQSSLGKQPGAGEILYIERGRSDLLHNNASWEATALVASATHVREVQQYLADFLRLVARC